MTLARAFLDTADPLPDPLLLVGRDAVIVAGNAAASRLLGQPALAGRTLPALADDGQERIDELMRVAFRTRTLTPAPLRLRLAGRGPTPCRVEGALFRPADPDTPLLAMLRIVPHERAVERFAAHTRQIEQLTREVAMRQRAEAVLHAERERLRVTLSSIGDAVLVTDLEGRLTFMNPVAEALTGWTLAEARGRPLDEVFVIVAEDGRKPVESPLREVLRTGAVAGLANHTLLISRDGTERPIDDSGAPVRDDRGRVIGVVLVFHDVSERRAMERDLRRHADALATANRSKDEFLAMLAHELRNPLAALANGLYLIRRHASAASPSHDLAQVTGMMDRQLRHLTRLVDDLLDVSRITRGKIGLERRPMAIADALSMAIEQARAMLDAKRQLLDADLPPRSLQVDGDAGRLAQVFSNLLSNASKFSGEAAEIRVGWQSLPGGRIAVHVSDPGAGIAAEAVGNVFDLFFQGNVDISRAQGGLGVGLTVVRAVVEAHGGSVRVHSEGPRRGSVFTVELPLWTQRPTEDVDAGEASDAQPFPRRRVLVVDDNVDHARSLVDILECWGCATTVAHDGEAALDAAARTSPDVVLLDLGLPGIDGYEVARRLRRAGASPVSLIAITGYGRSEDRQRALGAGFDHHLTKPVELAALHQLLGGSAEP